jgi:hypothetical protein
LREPPFQTRNQFFRRPGKREGRGGGGGEEGKREGGGEREREGEREKLGVYNT